MSNEQFILHEEKQRESCIEKIQSLKLDLKLKWKIIITKHRRDISTEQRGLYWTWIGVIAKDTGYEKDEQHWEFKKLYLLPIFYENLSGNHDKLVKMVDAINKVYDQPQVVKDLWDGLYDLLSITRADTKEMSEYMNRIYRECTNPDGLQIYLPLPESSGVM